MEAMFLRRRLFFLVFVCLLPSGCAGGDIVKEIPVRGHWRKIFEDVNNTTSPLDYKIRHHCGLRHPPGSRGDNTVLARSPLGPHVSPGDRLRVISIDSCSACEERSDWPGTTTTSKDQDPAERSELTVEFQIPPRSRLLRWQYVADVAGNEYHCSLVRTADRDEVPADLSLNATLALRREIVFGKTPIRIKHRKTEQYVTMIETNDWLTGTLGLSGRYHFVLTNYSGGDAIAIRSLRSLYPGLEYLVAFQENARDVLVYADLFKKFKDWKALYWFVSKEPPLYDGDIVSFRNLHYANSHLCYFPEAKLGSKYVDLSCRPGREDEWILEVV